MSRSEIVWQGLRRWASEHEFLSFSLPSPPLWVSIAIYRLRFGANRPELASALPRINLNATRRGAATLFTVSEDSSKHASAPCLSVEMGVFSSHR
jgi:hypothetical protein